MAETTGSDYKNPPESTKNTDSYKLGIQEKLLLILDNTPVSKLFLILIMVAYTMALYSKGKIGIEQDDVTLLVFFGLFVIGCIIFLDIATFLHRILLLEVKKQKIVNL